MSVNRTRVALVVFADVECSDGSNLDPIEAAMFVRHAIRQAMGDFDGRSHTVALPKAEFAVRIHEAQEVGMAAGNGYLWSEVTSKAFCQYTWQENARDVSAFVADVGPAGEKP